MLQRPDSMLHNFGPTEQVFYDDLVGRCCFSILHITRTLDLEFILAITSTVD